MRRVVLRAALVGGAAAAVVAVGSARQPAPVPKGPPAPFPLSGGVPDPVKLKADAAALAKEREAAAKEAAGPTALATEREVLQARLLDLIKRLAEQRAAPAAPPAKGPPGKFDLPDRVRPSDAVRAAEDLFRGGNALAALGVLRQIDRTQLGREDRVFAQYLTACCLRREGRRAEAVTILREVADAREDEFLAECAVSQIALIRSADDLEAQLRQLAARPQPR